MIFYGNLFLFNSVRKVRMRKGVDFLINIYIIFSKGVFIGKVKLV